ncbi:fungal-specific transcription factor domain-containing protein [Xylariaceae sp. FL0662B]|nr:fungal-specific transcription factor domain-containing protein [Xylariaceae sp. FL0662B]
MTRPKVPHDKRQRTAQACDSCKRRKQKCNGLKPCNTCTKRHLECLYTPTNLEQLCPLESPTKRRRSDNSPKMLKSTLETGQSTTTHSPSLTSWNQSADAPVMAFTKTESPGLNQKKSVGTTRHLLSNIDRDFDTSSRVSNTSGAADEADIFHLPRMLQDSTGRLLYVGDSATLACLQLIRMIVESIAGPSEFTIDPRRHMIMENTISLPENVRPTGVLPDRKTADILMKSFFTNTSGFIEVFDREAFVQEMEECYKDPLGISQSRLCILYLVFAIGLVLARPVLGSVEADVIQRLRSEPDSRAELFFRNAKGLADPVSGFEDADFWSIQALLLMSLYMLTVSKRNASYAYYGMAVRSAFALGLHREESMVIFDDPQRRIRKQLLRTLFVLDRFLAACLGRPTAISDEDCSEGALEPPRTTAAGNTAMTDNAEATDSGALDAAVRSCHLIGITLKKVYSKRKISTTLAQEIANDLVAWNRELHPNLRWGRIMNGSIDPSQGIAILHTNLLHCHSVMLLTRPFFLYILKKTCEHHHRKPHGPSRLSPRMENFAQTCVEASQHTLVLAQAALDAGYLPQCNPFVIHFVFAAALILLSNEFASLYRNPDAGLSIRQAIAILKYCAQGDKQADRVLYIVESFSKANVAWAQQDEMTTLPGRKIPIIPTLSQNSQFDPMSNFFHIIKAEHRDPRTDGPPPMKDQPMMAVTTIPPAASLPSMMLTTVQQPSPEGSVSLSSGMAVTMAPGMDPLSGGDTEFDFDSLWNGWPTVPTGGMSIPQELHPTENFGAYVLSQPQVPHATSLNANVPLYPPSDFR